jgi:hypothetical protein
MRASFESIEPMGTERDGRAIRRSRMRAQFESIEPMGMERDGRAAGRARMRVSFESIIFVPADLMLYVIHV